MRTLRLVAAVALALGAAACGDDEGGGDGADAPRPDAANTDAMDVDAPPAVTLTAFVIDLVTNQTAGNTNPRAYADFETLPDPDSNNPAAYTALFP
jgi:hypothetical protein